jgi:hypothetical protein
MKITVPWWLWPWPQAKRNQAHIALGKALTRELEQQAADYEQRIDDLCETARQDMATIAHLEGELLKATSTVTGALSTQRPDWVLVGIPRPGAGVRVWASRELSGTAFDMTPMDEPPPRWQIKATMAQALTVDEADYAVAMAKISTIWQNWDRTAREETHTADAGRPRLRELDQGRMGIRSGAAKERWRSNLPALPPADGDQPDGKYLP